MKSIFFLLVVTGLVFSCQSDEVSSGMKDGNSQKYTQNPKSTAANVDQKNVDAQPQPNGGIESFYDYVANNIKYPDEAKKAGIQGKVIVQFLVNEDGSLSNVKILQGIGGGCDEQAIEVITNSPKWIPGKKGGKIAKVEMLMPINFKLS